MLYWRMVLVTLDVVTIVTYTKALWYLVTTSNVPETIL